MSSYRAKAKAKTVAEPKAAAQATTEAEQNGDTALLLALIILALGGAVAWILFSRKRAHDVAAAEAETEAETAAEAEAEAAAEVEAEAEAEWPIDQERRFSLRVDAPPGAMIIHWTNHDGTRHQGEAINVSMHGVLFKSPLYDAESIDRVVCSRLSMDLTVVKSTIQRTGDDTTAAVLEAFENDIDSRMSWIELLTRIDEE